MFDITPIIIFIITVLSAVIEAYVIPFIKAKTDAARRENAYAIVSAAVAAAEQTIRGSRLGECRLNFVKSWLADRGLTLDEDELTVYIESAVYELNHNLLMVEPDTGEFSPVTTVVE